jgi:hypothetical protein
MLRERSYDLDGVLIERRALRESGMMAPARA